MILDLSIIDIAKGLKDKKFTSVDLVGECYKNIEKYNPTLNACITVCDKKEVLENAKKKDAERTASSNILFGIPFIIKDSYLTSGIRTTCASKVLENFIPPYNATVYQKLLDAGAILLAKCNMDAWGHGSTSENTDFGPVKNPWNTERSAGGSTGGVAVAIATRMAVFGIGEDTGGSIRSPSAWCNTTGLKVTYGRVSRNGCIAYVSSFDTVGPMAKTAEDCAVILEVIAGKDEYDATSSPTEVPKYSQKMKLPKKLTIGMPKEYFTEGLNKDILDRILDAAKTFETLGHTVIEISMPSVSYAIAAYYLMAPSETSSNLARYDGIRYGTGRQNFTAETDRRILIGTYALSAGYYDAYYKKAQKARTLFIEAYKKAFTECDVLLMPITPMQPTKLGEIVSDPVQNMLIDTFTVTHNPVGVPSLALPCGFSSDNLPIGMQITAPMFKEELLFALAQEFQNTTDFHTKKPKLIEY